MTVTALNQLVKDYIEAWSTTDAQYRKELIERVYSVSADFYANEPGDEAVHHHGWEAIFRNITQVNERLVVGNKLITERTDYAENHNTLRVQWKMKTPDDNIAVSGMNFLQLDTLGRVIGDYIFIN